MIRYLLLLALTTLSLFASSGSHFKETRYLYALNKSIELDGYITFGDYNIMIEYVKPTYKVLTYFEEKLTIQDDNGFQSIEAQKMPSINYFFMIVKAVHDDNMTLIDTFFTSQTTNTLTTLTPIGVAAEVLEKASIKKDGTGLRFLEVSLKNGDRISIEILD